MRPLRVFSYGGGTQSTAALVLAVQDKIDFPHFVFANVGDDSEHPRTIAYVRTVAAPYAAANGINLEEVQRVRRDGTVRTLYQHVMASNLKGVQIPMRFARSGSPARRHCTIDYKIKVLGKWHREHGASAENPAHVGIGISWDELQRMRTSTDPERIIEYPLVDLRLTRSDCERIIREAGLPQPGRSSCWFCPYKTQREWQRMRHEEPEVFAKAVEMEQHMADKMEAEGEGPVTFHSKGDLAAITSPLLQMSLPTEMEDACESGYCMV